LGRGIDFDFSCCRRDGSAHCSIVSHPLHMKLTQGSGKSGR
jgi:hypothetical protein